MDIKIITVASEMTSNISKLNNNNFHPESSIYMNSLRRHLSRIVIFPACACTKKQSCRPTHSRHPGNHQNFSFFGFFMLCVVFFFFIFYIEPTIFLREMCMANGQEWGILHGSKSTQELLVCLFVRQMSKQRKKQR